MSEIIEFAQDTEERIRFISDGRFRIRVIRESKNLVSIHYEAYREDTGTWAVTGKTIRLPREEIKAAAELLGI